MSDNKKPKKVHFGHDVPGFIVNSMTFWNDAENPFKDIPEDQLIPVSDETVLTGTIDPSKYRIVHIDERATLFKSDEQLFAYSKLKDLINEFANAMLDKLAKKVVDGYTGWDDPSYLTTLSNLLRDRAALDNGTGLQAVDMANFAAFIWGQTQRGKENNAKPV